MLSESIAVGIAVTLLLGAVCFYLYSRISYAEKKMSMMEALLIDIKMMIEASEEEAPVPHPVMPLVGDLRGVPASEPAPATGTAPPLAKPVDEAAVEENFYSSVLEQAHTETEAEVGTSITEALEGMAAETEATAPASASVGPNYDAMTRQELSTLAEQRGLRVTKRMGRGELINLLRTNDKSQNSSQTTGTENGSGGAAGALFPNAAPVDGEFPVDLGQGAGTLEESQL